jgi:hypothetical protein
MAQQREDRHADVGYGQMIDGRTVKVQRVAARLAQDEARRHQQERGGDGPGAHLETAITLR